MAEHVEDFFAHYGVLGMKWGRTRSDAQLARAANRRKSNHEDYNNSRDALKTPSNRLSTRDIQTTNQRLKQEKTLRDLRADQQVIKKGSDQVKGILAITTVVASVYALGKSELGKKVIDKGKSIVDGLLASNGRHTLEYAAPVIREAARHLR